MTIYVDTEQLKNDITEENYNVALEQLRNIYDADDEEVEDFYTLAEVEQEEGEDYTQSLLEELDADEDEDITFYVTDEGYRLATQQDYFEVYANI